MYRSKHLLIAFILGILYLLALSFNLTHPNSSNALEAIGAALAIIIFAPHMICVAIALIFNLIGWIFRARWAALVAGIIYAISIACMSASMPMVIVQMILCFVAFAKMKQPDYEAIEWDDDVQEDPHSWN